MFLSNTKLFLHNQNNQQVPAAPTKLKILNLFQTPETNSQTFENYYEVKEAIKQHVCSPKPHGKMAFKEEVLNYLILSQKQHFSLLANCIWSSYLFVRINHLRRYQKNIFNRTFNFQMVLCQEYLSESTLNNVISSRGSKF